MHDFAIFRGGISSVQCPRVLPVPRTGLTLRSPGSLPNLPLYGWTLGEGMGWTSMLRPDGRLLAVARSRWDGPNHGANASMRLRSSASSSASFFFEYRAGRRRGFIRPICWTEGEADGDRSVSPWDGTLEVTLLVTVDPWLQRWRQSASPDVSKRLLLEASSYHGLVILCLKALQHPAKTLTGGMSGNESGFTMNSK